MLSMIELGISLSQKNASSGGVDTPTGPTAGSTAAAMHAEAANANAHRVMLDRNN
jgi:hypothetical protein